MSGEKSQTAKILSDRIYYVKNKTVGNAEDSTKATIVQRTVYSVSLDGTDVKTEYKAPEGMEVKIVAQNGRLVIFDEKEAHIRQDDGTYKTIETTDLADENTEFTEDGNELICSVYGEKGNAELGQYDISTAKFYRYGKNLSKELILDIEKSGASVTGEFYSLKRVKSYIIIEATYDQYDDGIYIFTKKGKFIRKVSTKKTGEDNGYYYTITNKTLYAAIYNVKRSRYDFETYQL